jgi:alpha-galactosidase
MRDVLNETGKQVFFSLCGWHDWYARPDPSLKYTGGASLGNSWRIHGDGKNWTYLSGAVNDMARLTAFTGPGGWNDPDLLIGPTCTIEGVVCGNTDLQARTQFSLWALFPAPLILSQDVLKWSEYALETYSEEGVIQVNQDKAAKAGTRIQGGNLTFPCTPSAQDSCTNIWGRDNLGQDQVSGLQVQPV